jgi:hypothetical protein
MFRKIKRYVVDDIESAEKDVAVTIASLLYDVANDEGMDVLHYGRVFATNWAKGKKNGLDITFGAISAAAHSQSTRYSFMSVNIEEELNIKFKNSAIADLKARGAHAFSNACTFLVVNEFNELRRKQLSPPYELFHIPRKQPAARGQSKAYADAVRAGNYEEQAKLVRLSSNGPEKHLYIKPSLTIGHAETDELKLRESKLEFETYEHYEGFIR